MRSILVYFFIALIPVTLGACQPTVDVPPPVVGPVAEPGLTPKERNIKALDLLQEGKAEEARVELEASLAELPANKNSLARNLLSQIDGGPVDMLGSKNFKYEIARGESLSIIAEQYLGNKFNFYVLARYNGLGNPSLVKAGDVIKVPGVKPVVALEPPTAGVPTPPVGDNPEPPIAGIQTPPTGENPEPPIEGSPTPPGDGVGENKLLVEAGEQVNAGNYEVAINDLKEGLVEFPDSKAIKELRGDAYIKLGEKHIKEGKYAVAQSVFKEAVILYPDRGDITRRSADAGRAARADNLFLDGVDSFKNDSLIDAYESFAAATKIWPDHDRAQIELATIRPKVADIYYREAKTAYHRQDLEEALRLYNKTLEVDPNHELAALERQRTITLLKKFKERETAG